MTNKTEEKCPVVDLVIVNVSAKLPSIYTLTTPEKAKADFERAVKDYLDSAKRIADNLDEAIAKGDGESVTFFAKRLEYYKNAKFEIMTWDEFSALERKQLLEVDNEPVEIDAERFEQMLDVLPPLCWCTIDGFEMFCLREMYTGTYTNQYAHDKKTGKYWTRLVDICDKSTWIHNVLKEKR